MTDTSTATPDPSIRDAWTRRSMAIVALCFVLNMVDGMDVLVVTYISPALQTLWAVSPAQLSIVFSAGLAGMALGGLCLAPLADRFGRKRMIVVALMLMASAMYASSHARTVSELALIRVVVGTGIGTVLACIAAIAARIAPARHRNFAVGVLQAGYPIGAMITGFVAVWALPLVGWRSVLVGTAVVSAVFVPVVWLVMPETGSHRPGGASPRLRDAVGGTRRTASLLLWAATIGGFMALYFVTSWITRLAIEAGLPEQRAIVASAIYNFGAFVGTVASSLAATRFDVRKLCAGLLVLTAGVFLWFGGVAMPLSGVLITAFVMGVTLQGGYNLVYPIAALAYPDDVRATGIGWAFGIGRIGAFTGPLLGGWALSQHWPLIGVFALFCLPLAVAATAALTIRPEGLASSVHQ